jgi:hypothetical protein
MMTLLKIRPGIVSRSFKEMFAKIDSMYCFSTKNSVHYTVFNEYTKASANKSQTVLRRRNILMPLRFRFPERKMMRLRL